MELGDCAITWLWSVRSLGDDCARERREKAHDFYCLIAGSTDAHISAFVAIGSPLFGGALKPNAALCRTYWAQSRHWSTLLVITLRHIRQYKTVCGLVIITIHWDVKNLEYIGLSRRPVLSLALIWGQHLIIEWEADDRTQASLVRQCYSMFGVLCHRSWWKAVTHRL